jgi:hypothetical protein
MGRKSRRKAKLRAAARLAQRAPVERTYPTKPMPEPKLETKAAVSVGPVIAPVQVNRYQYVIPELRRIAIISGALFIILIILTFILH